VGEHVGVYDFEQAAQGGRQPKFDSLFGVSTELQHGRRGDTLFHAV
jgi:hypothetical protein